MVEYRIELRKLQEKFNKQFKRRGKSAHVKFIKKLLKDIKVEELNKNPFQPNDEQHTVFIPSEQTSFPFLLAIYNCSCKYSNPSLF
jgi:hypothetical protein